MHYISQSNEPSVKELIELEITKYNPRTGDNEHNTSLYRVSQTKKFKITPEIDGRVFWSTKEKTEYAGKTSYIDMQNLEISSNTVSLKKMIDWVETIEKEYKQYIKSKMLDRQTLVELTWNNKDSDIDAFYTNWGSNVTFDNRFFTGKKEILDKINSSHDSN